MPLLHPFSGNEAKAKEPINEDLTDLKYKENIEDLAAQIDAISGGGSGGGVDTGDIGEILLGGDTNEGRYWKRRFHVLEHMLNADSDNPSGFDPEGHDLKNELLTFIQSNDTGLSIFGSTNTYLAQQFIIAKSSKISFKVKKGINFFSILTDNFSNSCDNVEITIDGNTPSSLGLTDENGDAATDTYSTTSSTTFRQFPRFFYGLDGEEHIITILNNDSGSNNLVVCAIEVGYRSENPTINETVKINAGKASVRGTEVSFDETEVTFSKTELNGHTGSIVCDNTGTITALDGECPAMTQVKAEENIQFSSTVTTLPVKNNFYFPDNGICMLSTPHGNHHMFSYTGKTDTLIQSHSFDNLKWGSQPTEDFIPLDGFAGGAGAATGDLNINYWGTAPILIDSTNNKLDFEITIAGVTTVHAATIDNGRYAADLVPLENAVRKAMQTVKPLAGEYHLKYNADSQLWTIYVDDEEVEAFTLLFGSGLNSANSVHPTIGFSNSDKSGDLSYIGTTEVQHLCCRVFEKDSTYMHVEDPRIKYSNGINTSLGNTSLDVVNRLNLGSIRYMTSSPNNYLIQLHPDEDAVGMELSFLMDNNHGIISVQVDDGQVIYLSQTDTVIPETAVRGTLITGFISFPKGSRKISVRNETTSSFEIVDSTPYIVFTGARQYFSKPAYEKLTKTQAILKTFEVSPISLYATEYGHNGGVLYSPAVSDDHINTVTESGSWAGSTITSFFNRSSRTSSSTGSYQEINFTLQGNGGGIAIRRFFQDTNYCKKMACFLSTSAINESTDRIQNTHTQWGTGYYDQKTETLLGLPAGTYNFRVKLEDSNATHFNGIIVYDTVSPQENANTVTDINNTGQGVSYPINVRRETIQQDSADRVPVWLDRSGYKEGRVSKVNYSLNSPSLLNYDDASTLITNATSYYGNFMSDTVIGNFTTVSAFMKSVSLVTGNYSDRDTLSTFFVDGVQGFNTFSQRVQVKGGLAPSTTRASSSNLVQKEFKISATFNSGNTFDVADTRGMKLGQVVLLDDGTNKEKAVIDSIVVGVSFTVKKARTTVVDANVTTVEFQGFHTFKVVAGTTSTHMVNCYEYEPLKISPSKALYRVKELKYEKVSVTYKSVQNGDDLHYPVHSDGVVGNWTTSTIEVIQKDVDTGYTIGQDLKNITITSAKNMGFKITSERLVPVLDEKDRF